MKMLGFFVIVDFIVASERHNCEYVFSLHGGVDLNKKTIIKKIGDMGKCFYTSFDLKFVKNWAKEHM